MVRPARLAIAAVAFVLVSGLDAGSVLPAHAQESGLSRSEYLGAVGLLDAATDIEMLLLNSLEAAAPDWPLEQRTQTSALFSYILTVNGLTADVLVTLSEEGLDVLHAITSDSRPLVEQALLTDLVIVGKVLREEEEEGDPPDGRATSTYVNVLRRLKGELPSDTIVIRQQHPVEARPRDIRPEKGRTYLLLLSNGIYRYGAARRAAEISEARWTPSDAWRGLRHYSIYRIYPMDRDGRVDFAGYDLRQTEQSFQEIERLDRRLQELSGRGSD